MLIIFDLDGTLTPQRPSSTASFSRVLLPNVRERCAELADAGCIFAIATNQGGLRKGLPQSEVDDVLAWISGELGITACKFASGREPERKKPQPGMLLELMCEFDASPVHTLFVGDSESDRRAAKRAEIPFEWAADFFRRRGE